MKTYVIGHKKPDLDSVVAAISIAQFNKKLGKENVIPAITEGINEETKFIFKKFDATPPEIINPAKITPEDHFILVDHNEVEQRLDGLNPEQIIKIYDHHKVNLNIAQPIEIQAYPVGSTNTIAWLLFKQNNISIDHKTACLMICAILSDTVGLKSSTTTNTDKKAVANLSATSAISDVEALTLEIFKAKSNINSLNDEQVVLNDYKIFDFSGKKVLIGQTETVEQKTIISEREDALLAAMEKIKKQQKVDYIFLALTDILKVNTKLLIIGDDEKELAQKAFGISVTNNILDIGPKMSRKKDIAPLIEAVLAK